VVVVLKTRRAAARRADVGNDAAERTDDMGAAMSVNAAAPLLRVEGVRKRYPNGVEAVKSISLDVRPGEVFGLVGPNAPANPRCCS
jgi:ABC-type glutathione transport system ATPase component